MQMRISLLLMSLSVAVALREPVRALGQDTARTTRPAAAGQFGRYEFSMKTLDGRSVRLSDYAGKVVLVHLWAPWCAPCTTEVKGFASLDRIYSPRGLVILGVAVRTTESAVRTFVHRYGVRWSVGIQDSIARLYGAVGLPNSYLFGRDGRLLKAFVGYTHAEVLKPLLEQALPP